MIRIKIVFFFFQPIISLLYLDFGLPQLRLQRQQQQQQMLRLFSLNLYHENFFFSTFSSTHEILLNNKKVKILKFFFSIHTFKHVQGIFFFLVLKKRYDSLITSCTRLICVNETKKNKNETEKNDYEFYWFNGNMTWQLLMMNSEFFGFSLFVNIDLHCYVTSDAEYSIEFMFFFPFEVVTFLFSLP